MARLAIWMNGTLIRPRPARRYMKWPSRDLVPLSENCLYYQSSLTGYILTRRGSSWRLSRRRRRRCRRSPVGAGGKNDVTSCDLDVFADRAAESSASVNWGVGLGSAARANQEQAPDGPCSWPSRGHTAAGSGGLSHWRQYPLLLGLSVGSFVFSRQDGADGRL